MAGMQLDITLMQNECQSQGGAWETWGYNLQVWQVKLVCQEKVRKASSILY